MLPTIAREAEVRTLVGEVLRHGVSSDNVTLVALIIARPALRVLKDEFPGITLIAAAVDECVHGKLLPGIGSFEARYPL